MALSPPKSKLPPLTEGEPPLTAKEQERVKFDPNATTTIKDDDIFLMTTSTETTNIVPDITKLAHCLRCGIIFPKSDWKMTTIGNPETGQLFTYRPLCASCIDAIKPTGDNMKQQ